MPPQETVPDDGTTAYAMRFSAAALINSGLNQPGDALHPEFVGQKFFSLKREAACELALALYTVVKRYYAENPPDSELLDEWESMKR